MSAGVKYDWIWNRRAATSPGANWRKATNADAAATEHNRLSARWRAADDAGRRQSMGINDTSSAWADGANASPAADPAIAFYAVGWCVAGAADSGWRIDRIRSERAAGYAARWRRALGVNHAVAGTNGADANAATDPDAIGRDKECISGAS